MSEFVERISKWHQMLRPVLVTSEKRSNFDIHALGTDIMNKFDANTAEEPTTTEMKISEITFSDVMDGRDETCTARYFLSLLLLANNKNIYLNKAHPEQNGHVICSPDDIKIQFRNQTRHWDEVKRIDEHLEEARTRVDEHSPSAVSNQRDNTEQREIVSRKSTKVAQKRRNIQIEHS